MGLVGLFWFVVWFLGCFGGDLIACFEPFDWSLVGDVVVLLAIVCV